MNKTALCENTNATDAFTQLNTRIVQKLGIKEAIVLYELYGQQEHFYSEKPEENRLKDGFFYATNDFLTANTLLSIYQIRSAVKTLEDTWVYMKNKKAKYGKYYKEYLEKGNSEAESKELALKKCEDDYTEMIAKLKNDIQDVLDDKKIKKDKKKDKVDELKRKAGFENLVQTKITTSYGERIKWYRVHTLAVDEFIRHEDGSVSMNSIGPDAFIIYNKIIARETSPTAAVVFADIQASYRKTKKHNNLEEDGWFKNLQDAQAKRLGISRSMIADNETGYLIQLINHGLIEKKTMGEKNMTYIRIMWDKYYEMLGGIKIEETDDGVIIRKQKDDIEEITKRLLNRVKEVSGQDWPFAVSKSAFIYQRLAEGLNEEDLYNIIEYKYKDYKRLGEIRESYFERFNWTNLFGSECEKWINNMHNQEVQDEKKLKYEALSLRIIEEVKKVVGIDWILNEKYYPLLEHQLNCQVSEDELVELIKHQYNWKLKHEGKIKNFTWNKIYGEFQDDNGRGYSCFATILAMRQLKNDEYLKQHPEAEVKKPKGTYNPETKKFKMGNPEQRQGMNINTNGDMRGISQEEVIRRAKETGEMLY